MNKQTHSGFSLIEVVLAIGIISVAVVALVALMAQTMPSVQDVVDSNRATNAIGKVNAFIQNEDFEDVYGWFGNASDTHRVYAYTTGGDPTGNDLLHLENQVTDQTGVYNGDINDIEGPVFVFVLQRSGLLTDWGTSADELAYMPIFVEVHAFDGRVDISTIDDAIEDDTNLLFSYTTAKNR